MTALPDSDLTRRHTAGEKLERLRIRIRSQFPAYAQLRDPEPLGLAAAQALLPAGTLLLCYHVSDDGCAIWAVRRTGWHVAVLAAGLPALARDIDTALTPCRAARPRHPTPRRRGTGSASSCSTRYLAAGSPPPRGSSSSATGHCCTCRSTCCRSATGHWRTRSSFATPRR